MPNSNSEKLQVAEKIRQTCVQTAITAYEDARMDGLCHQGAWESAISALEKMDLESLIRQLDRDSH